MSHWSDPANVIAMVAVFFTAALVGVGIFTLLAIRAQTKRTADAAEAALRSVKIQEAQLKQWFGVTNWLSQLQTRGDGTNTLVYGLNITNPTEIPLDIRRITIRSGATQQDSGFAALLIPPKESYEINTFDTLNDESLLHFKTSGLVRTYEITAEFNDPFNPGQTVTRTQTFLCVFKIGTPKVDVRLQPTQVAPPART